MFLMKILAFVPDEETMDAMQQQVQELMSIGDADTVLLFEDGVIYANSTVLSLFSSVLRGAVEAHSAGPKGSSSQSSSSSSSSAIGIPMQGLTTTQWLTVAPLWYPVTSKAVVKTWDQLELALDIGSRFDIHPVLHKASDFLTANVKKLSQSCHACGMLINNPSLSVWKWLQLADERVLSCVPALVRRAVLADRRGCSKPANLQRLSAATLKQLVAALVPGPQVYMYKSFSHRGPGPCPTCSPRR